MLNGSFHIEMWAIGKFASAATTSSIVFYERRKSKEKKNRRKKKQQQQHEKERNIVKWVTFLAYFLHFLVVLFSHLKESNPNKWDWNGNNNEHNKTSQSKRRQSERSEREKKRYAKWQILRNVPHDQTMRMKHEHTTVFCCGFHQVWALWLSLISFRIKCSIRFGERLTVLLSFFLFCFAYSFFSRLHLLFCLIPKNSFFFPMCARARPFKCGKITEGKEDFKLSTFQPSRFFSMKKTLKFTETDRFLLLMLLLFLIILFFSFYCSLSSFRITCWMRWG